MKKIVSIALILSMTICLFGCTPGLKDRIRVEEELSRLNNIEGNTWINEDEEYESMVNSLLYIERDVGLPGAWIVATDDDIIYATGKGILDNDGNVVDPFTTFEIGSMSKSFVSVCIFKLVEEGRISLADTLGDLFPDYSYCPNYGRTSKVTISDMLHMRSGIPDYLNAPTDFWGPDLFYEILGPDMEELSPEENHERFFSSVDERTFLESVFTCEPDNEPDRVFAYSNTNFYLLSVIIEHLTGMAYQDYVRETVFDPCGMTSTSSMAFGDVQASLPEGAYYFRPEYSKGAGDIHSNVVDILRYDRALFGGYLLSEESMETMLEPISTYACGFQIKGDMITHGGDTPGFTSAHYIIERNGQHLYVIGWSHQGTKAGILNILEHQFDPKPKHNTGIFILAGTSAAVICASVFVIVRIGKKKKRTEEKA